MKKIRLWKNRNELSDKYTLVDDEDYDKVVGAKDKRGRPRKWYCHSNGSPRDYAMSGSRRESVHRLVMGNPEGMDIDHINGNPLDNRKQNLRVCTRSENARNQRIKSHSQSGYKGVYEIKKQQLKKPFMAYISEGVGKNSTKLGYYETAEEAAEVRDKRALQIHGEFALLNFPEKRQALLEELYGKNDEQI